MPGCSNVIIRELQSHVKCIELLTNLQMPGVRRCPYFTLFAGGSGGHGVAYTMDQPHAGNCIDLCIV